MKYVIADKSKRHFKKFRNHEKRHKIQKKKRKKKEGKSTKSKSKMNGYHIRKEITKSAKFIRRKYAKSNQTLG
jgi:hypothetical protein